MPKISKEEEKTPLAPSDNNEKRYPCVFDLEEDCPVRRHFKLMPENLVKFCRVCPILHEEKLEIEEEILSQCVQCKEKILRESYESGE